MNYDVCPHVDSDGVDYGRCLNFPPFFVRYSCCCYFQSDCPGVVPASASVVVVADAGAVAPMAISVP